MASRYSCLGIAGCLTLLQCWIYEYFPCFRPHRERHVISPGYPRSMLWNVRCEDKNTARLQSIQRRLDMLQALGVWMPYWTDPSKDVPRTLMVGCIRYRDIVEPYMLGRSLRQLGHVQVVPMPLLRDREMMPSAASRQACDEVERLISMWNRTLGRQQESQHDSDGSET
ncbi:Protein MAINTENANCE OF MERISTEMS [Bienertia sinuspersici]